MTVGTPSGYTQTSHGLVPTQVAQAEARYSASHPSSSSSIKPVSGSSGSRSVSSGSGNKAASVVKAISSVSGVTSVSSPSSSISPIAGLFKKNSPIGIAISKIVSQHSPDSGVEISSDASDSPSSSSVVSSGSVPKSFAKAGGESNFRTILQNKYPNLSSDKIDRLIDIQKVKEGTLSASSVFGTPDGMDPKTYDLAEAQIFGSMGYGAPLSHSEKVAAFNIATGVDNANSPAYQSALAADLSRGFNVQDYSNVSGLTQAQISTNAISRLAGGQNVKELTPSYSDFRSEYRQANPGNISGLQNNWYAYNKGWITKEEALSGTATHMPTVGIPSKHPTEAYIPPGYNWDPNLGIMTRPSIEVGQASGGGLQELTNYDNGSVLSSIVPVNPGVSVIMSGDYR